MHEHGKCFDDMETGGGEMKVARMSDTYRNSQKYFSGEERQWTEEDTKTFERYAEENTRRKYFGITNIRFCGSDIMLGTQFYSVGKLSNGAYHMVKENGDREIWVFPNAKVRW